MLARLGMNSFDIQLLPAANEVCEGYVFTHVCQSFCSQGGMCGQGACMPGGGVCMVGGMHAW